MGRGFEPHPPHQVRFFWRSTTGFSSVQDELLPACAHEDAHVWSWVRRLAVGVLLLAGLAACGTPAVCSDLDAVKDTTQQLKARHLTGSDTIGDVQHDLSRLNSEVRKLVSDASSQYSSQVNAVKSSLTALGSAAQAVVANLSSATLAQLDAAVHQLGTSVDNLSQAVSDTC